MQRSTLHLACILALCAAGTAAAQTPLTQTTSQAAQPLLGPGGLGVIDNSSRDGGESRVQVNTVGLSAFDKATGVLVGVGGAVVVDSATQLVVERPNSGGNYDGFGTVRAEWALPSGATAFGVLARIQVDGDNLVGTADTWTPMSHTAAAAALDSFVADAAGQTLNTTITTHLVASKAKAGGGENYVTATTSSALTGSFSLQYSFLHHASAAFDAAGATSLAVQVAGTGADVQLRALGDAAHTTRLDLLDVTCVAGACDADILGWRRQDLDAGQAANFHIGAGARSATYALLLGDDTSTGAAASLQQRTLTLSVSAVPEPGTWALLLAGMAVVGVRARRMARAA